MRRRPSKGSWAARASSTTRVMIDPTVRHATRSSSPTADFEVWVTSQAIWSSKSLVWPAPWRAQGTCATVGPWVGQFTRGASAWRWQRRTPTLPATALLRASGTDVDDHGSSLFVEVDRLDHRRPVDTEQFAPYVDTEHAILLASNSNL